MIYDVLDDNVKLKNLRHLRQELILLNESLMSEVQRLSAENQYKNFDRYQGLAISEQEVLHILSETAGEQINAESVITENQKDHSNLSDPNCRLGQLTALFRLNPVERKCIVLCLAPEIDSRYLKVYAYIQDDVTKKYPTMDLALTILGNSIFGRIAARTSLLTSSSLIRNRIFRLGDYSDQHAHLLQHPLWLDERIAGFLLDSNQQDKFLQGWVNFYDPSIESHDSHYQDNTNDQIIQSISGWLSEKANKVNPIVYLYGKKNGSRRNLAIKLSQKLNVPLIIADVNQLPATAQYRTEALWRLGRESYLQKSLIYIDQIDHLLEEEQRPDLIELIKVLNYYQPLTVMSGRTSWKVHLPLQQFWDIECETPSINEQVNIWEHSLATVTHKIRRNEIEELANTYNMTEDQINTAIKRASDHACIKNHFSVQLTKKNIQNSCRDLTTLNLKGFGQKIEWAFNWNDIVLPEMQLAQLREIAAHVKHSHTIYEKWGYKSKFKYGRSVTSLFNGLSGTGKTMAASIIGNELGLDVYKIDLSGVVSKYIGETEKNLTRIFNEAQNSSSILFFDEADALFGKRSEIKDAHDRYANLETAYLLQKIEEYEGIIILATNMKQNLDEAFIRRIRFIIHFPFPSDAERLRIWEKSFPESAPLSKDVDFHWLARKLKISGGHIKNISLRAAFLAVERGEIINMDCLIEAARRELGKTGKVINLIEPSQRDSNDVLYNASGI